MYWIRHIPPGRRRHSLRSAGTDACSGVTDCGPASLNRSQNFLVRFLISGSASRPRVLHLLSRIYLPHSFTAAPLFTRSWGNRAGFQVWNADPSQLHSGSLNRLPRLLPSDATFSPRRGYFQVSCKWVSAVFTSSATLCERSVLDTESLHLYDDMTAITL